MSSENSETRNRILRSAWKLLEADKGKGVRMSDIARQAGISRQAVYLHFPTRSELLVATTRYLDDINDAEGRLAPSRKALKGEDRLNAFVEAWGNYIPEIYGVARALLALKDTDVAAELAWKDRMLAVREGCEAAIVAIKKDGRLVPNHSVKRATDILWTLLSIRNWEQLTKECGLSQKQYIDTVKLLARRTLVIDFPAR